MKKIFLLIVITLQCLACADDDRIITNRCIYKATFCNNVDVDLHLELYDKGAVVETHTIPAMGDITLTQRFIRFVYIDSLYGKWGEREFLWKGEALLPLHLAHQKAKLENICYLVYSFDFTREMYDAATPIVPPAEE